MRREQVVSILNSVAAGVGLAGLVAPVATQRAFGAIPTPATNGAVRMISSRNVLIAALAARSDDDAIDDLLKLGAAMNVVDAATSIGTGLAHDEIPRRHMLSIALTTLGFAALQLYALSLD